MSKVIEYSKAHIEVAAEGARDARGSSVSALLALGYEVRLDEGWNDTRCRVYNKPACGGTKLTEARVVGKRNTEAAALIAHARVIALRERERAG